MKKRKAIILLLVFSLMASIISLHFLSVSASGGYSIIYSSCVPADGYSSGTVGFKASYNGVSGVDDSVLTDMAFKSDTSGLQFTLSVVGLLSVNLTLQDAGQWYNLFDLLQESRPKLNSMSDLFFEISNYNKEANLEIKSICGSNTFFDASDIYKVYLQKAAWERLSGEDALTLSNNGNDFIYDKSGSEFPTTIATQKLDYTFNYYSLDFKIEPDANMPGDFGGIMSFRNRDRNQPVWAAADGFFIMFGTSQTNLIIYKKTSDTSAEIDSKISLPIGFVDSQNHNLKVIFDDDAHTVTVIFDNDYVSRKFVLQSDSLADNMSGAVAYMSRQCVTTVSSFKMDDIDASGYYDYPRFVNTNIKQEYNFYSFEGEELGDTQAAMSFAYTGLATIDGSEVNGFANDRLSFTFSGTADADQHYYMFLTIRSSAASLPTWAGIHSLVLFAEKGNAVKIKRIGGGADENSASFDSGLNLFDGSIHTVEILIDDANKTVTGIIDKSYKAILTDDRIPTVGGYNFFTSYSKVRISDLLLHNAFDDSQMQREEVTFSPAMTFVNSEGVASYIGNVGSHFMAATEGQPAVRSAADNYAADVFKFKITKANQGWGIIALRAANSSTAVPWGVDSCFKLQINEDEVHTLGNNTDASSNAIGNANYFVRFSDGYEHTVIIRIYDNRTQNNVSLNVDGRQFLMTVANMPKTGGIYFMSEGKDFMVTDFAAYVSYIPVQEITLEESSVSIPMTAQDKTYQINAQVLPQNASVKSLSYTSSDTEVATVSETGLVTAVGVGEANITIEGADGKSATFKVIVTSGTINVTSVDIVDSQKVSITETLRIELDSYITLYTKILPENATNKAVSWSSQNESVATVDGNGKVTAVAKGLTTIMVTTSDGNFTDTVQIEVIGKQPASISIRDTSNTVISDMLLGVGDTFKIKAVVLPLDAEDRTYTLTSSDITILAVSEDGTLTGVKGGTATITARAANGVETILTVKVLEPVTPPQDDESLKDYMKTPITWGTHAGFANNVTLGMPLIITASGNVPAAFSTYTPDGSTVLPYSGYSSDVNVVAFKVKPNPSHNDFLAALSFNIYDGIEGAGTAFYTAKDNITILIYSNQSKLIYREDGVQVELKAYIPSETIPDLADGRTHYITLKIDRTQNKIYLKIDNLDMETISLPQGKQLKATGGVQVTAHNTQVTVSRFDLYDTSITLPSNIEVPQSSLSLEKGDTYEIIPSFTPDGEKTVKDVIFESSDSSKVSVDENGVITAIEKCENVIIKIISKYDSSISAQITVSVTETSQTTPAPTKTPSEGGSGCSCASSQLSAFGLILPALLALIYLSFRKRNSN